ncbi:MAG: hypothetical protein HY722_09405 [Planctomycetes bacterium]|nr:hypothetical protein [Planctomycetota bacterium]
MGLRTYCPACGRVFRMASESEGTRVECPCGDRFPAQALRAPGPAAAGFLAEVGRMKQDYLRATRLRGSHGGTSLSVFLGTAAAGCAVLGVAFLLLYSLRRPAAAEPERYIAIRFERPEPRRLPVPTPTPEPARAAPMPAITLSLAPTPAPTPTPTPTPTNTITSTVTSTSTFTPTVLGAGPGGEPILSPRTPAGPAGAVAVASDASGAPGPPRLPAGPSTATSVAGGGERELHFFGHPLPEDRKAVCFVVDRSGSMSPAAEPYPDLSGRITAGTKLDRARIEVKRSLRDLPDSYRFNVIFFDEGISKWRDRVRERTEANLADVHAFMDGFRPGGTTNTSRAVLEALRDPAGPTIILLSDGLPTAVDEEDDPIRIAALHRSRMLEANTAGAVIHAFGFDIDYRGRAFLERVAADHGGLFREVSSRAY